MQNEVARANSVGHSPDPARRKSGEYAAGPRHKICAASAAYVLSTVDTEVAIFLAILHGASERVGGIAFSLGPSFGRFFIGQSPANSGNVDIR